MFTPEITTTMLIEFYVLGVAGHLILLVTVFNATKPTEVSARTTRILFGMAVVSSLLWPSLDVLLMLMLTPLGGWFRGWVERKYGTSEDAA